MYDPADAHDPTLEPYASMGKQELLLLMELTTDHDEWAMLNEFMLDKMSTRELEANNRAHEIATFLINLYGADGNAQCLYLAEVSGRLATEIRNGMPTNGPPEPLVVYTEPPL